MTSFLALREYITLTPTHRSDHRALFWAFFVFTPLQYVLLAFGNYGVAVVMIPIYAYLFIPIRNVIAGDCEDFLARSAKIQWGLMICVYFVSYAPALFLLALSPGQRALSLYRPARPSRRVRARRPARFPAGEARSPARPRRTV